MSAVLSTIQTEGCALLRRVLGLNRAGAIAGTLVALFLARTLRAWYRLSHVPGPFSGGFSKWWMVRESLRGTQPYAIRDVIEEYGELYLFFLAFFLLLHLGVLDRGSCGKGGTGTAAAETGFADADRFAGPHRSQRAGNGRPRVITAHDGGSLRLF